MKFVLFSLFTLFLFGNPIFAALDVYSGKGLEQPGPKSPLFKVSISQDGITKDAHVYYDTNKRKRYGSEIVLGDSISWVDYGQGEEDKSTVTVTRIDGKPFTFKPTLRPTTYNLNETVKLSDDKKSVSFEVTGNEKMISVEYHNSEKDNNTKNALMIFASDLNYPVDVKAKNVKYFAPGEQSIEGDQVYHLEPHVDTVYVARGAFVHGKISIPKDRANIKVLGHGVLYGGDFDYTVRNTPGTAAFYAMVNGLANGTTVKGITMVDATRFHVVVWQQQNRNIVDNVKCMSWMYNTDGIQTRIAKVTDSFLRCNDDSIRFFSNNIEVERCVIWQLRNGSSFCCSWKWPKIKCENVTVKDCDVIHTEWDWMKFRPKECDGIGDNNGVFSLERRTDPIVMKNFRFKDIRIEGDCARVFNMKMGHGSAGKIHDIVFEDIKHNGEIYKFNQMCTSGGPGQRIENITFKNVTCGNELVTKENLESLAKFKFSGDISEITFADTEEKK